jgi:hypothetical protein
VILEFYIFWLFFGVYLWHRLFYGADMMIRDYVYMNLYSYDYLTAFLQVEKAI